MSATSLSSQSIERWETESYAGSFFEPDVLLPSQFMSKEEEGIGGGERRLMAAILSDGVEAYLEQAECYVKGISTRVDAIEWIEAKDMSYVFSFENVCSGLGINPEYLRLGLARYVHAIRDAKKAEAKRVARGSHGLVGSNDNIPLAPKWKKIRRPRRA
ncbi:MAG TPA: hypothetical protein PKA63_07295 [Oligoflexia bacterium]|nr:hypothetical protein [Oligoflexia bacterium]HMP48454.1 hypothetical protein [Oligoflexia bacterium]